MDVTATTPPERSKTRDIALLLLLCACTLWWNLGALGLIDPDEPFYAQTAREMLARHEWIVPHIFGAPQFEKPILYYWLVEASYAVFGVSEFAGRFTPALFGTLLVLMTYAFGRRTLGRNAGLCAAIVLATGILFAGMARMMLTDVIFAFFVSASVYAAWLACEDERHRRRWILLHFAAGALAVLTKGPLGSLIGALALAAFCVRTRRRPKFAPLDLVLGVLLYLAIAAPWYAMMLARFGRDYFDAFFVHENLDRLLHAEHASCNHVWYYPLVLIIGSFPWLPLLAVWLARSWREAGATPVRTYIWCWLLTSLVFLTIAQSKLPSYIYFLLVPIALLAGETLANLIEHGFRSKLERVLAFAFGLVEIALLPAVAVLAHDLRGALLAPAIAVSVLLALQMRRPTWISALTCAAGSALLFVLLTTFALPSIEEQISVRPAARRLLAQRTHDEPVITDKLLCRGLVYYTGLPVQVLAEEAQPFWSPHPLPVLVKQEGFQAFFAAHPALWCVLRPSVWKTIESSAGSAFKDESGYIGAKVVVRVGGSPH
jgi:4-amino-4-deoxy-L-arabinose transferase-like glycosyltransferase